jgi:hypothetical protein
MAKPTHLDHLTIMQNQLDSRLALQAEEWDGLDRKGTTIMGTTGVVLGLVVNNGKALQTLPDPAQLLFVGALAALVGGLVAGVFTLWPRGMTTVPDPERLKAYVDKDTEYLVGTLISTKVDAYEANGDPMKWKLWAVRAQMLLLTFAAMLLFLMLWYWG